MKYVKFTLRNKKEFTLPMEQAEQIMNSKEQMIMVSENGTWSGITLNKADILSTERDYEKEREVIRDTARQLPEPELTEEETRFIEEEKEKIRQMMKDW